VREVDAPVAHVERPHVAGTYSAHGDACAAGVSRNRP
jgi:hypothetical protein